jgi:Uma2 family endonuclease
MATERTTTRLTYRDLRAFPEDNLRRELIDGELIVTAAPATRHQDVVTRLVAHLYPVARRHGGKVYAAPTDVFFSDVNVVEPDVVFVGRDHRNWIEASFVRGAPDLVVEVSSPSTRRLELVRKRELYERFGVPEYWFVDLDADRVEIYRLEGHRYGPLVLRVPRDSVSVTSLPGSEITVEELLVLQDE